MERRKELKRLRKTRGGSHTERYHPKPSPPGYGPIVVKDATNSVSSAFPRFAQQSRLLAEVSCQRIEEFVHVHDLCPGRAESQSSSWQELFHLGLHLVFKQGFRAAGEDEVVHVLPHQWLVC